MADEQENIKINFDTNAKQAANDTNQYGKALNDVDNSTDKLTQSNKSLKSQIKEATIELIKAQEEFGDYSKQALDAAKNVATLKDKIAEASETANLFDPGKKFQVVAGAISAMASGFAVAQGAMGLFGEQSEELEKTLVKVQSAMALSQGLSSIADAGKDFTRLKSIVVDALKSIATAKALDAAASEAEAAATVQSSVATAADTTVKGGATAATVALTVATNLWSAAVAIATAPITLIVLAIAGLIAGIGYLTGAFGDFSGEAAAAAKNNKRLNSEMDSLEKQSKKTNEKMELTNGYLLDMAKASGKSSAEIRKLSEELANQEVAEKKANAQKAYSIYLEAKRAVEVGNATDAQKESLKRATELYKEQNKTYEESLSKRTKLRLDNRVAEVQEETDARNKAREAAQEAEKKRLEDLKEANKKRLEEIKAAQKKQAEELAALRKEQANIEQSLLRGNQDLNDKTEEEKLARQRQRAFEEIEILKKKGIDVESITRLTEEKFITLEDELRQKRKEEQQKAYDADLEAIIANKDLSIEMRKEAIEEEQILIQEQYDNKILSEEEFNGKQKLLSDARLEIAQNEADALKAIEEAKTQVRAVAVSDVENIGKQLQVLAGKNKAVQKAGLIVEGAVGLAKIVSNTMQAVTKTQSTFPGPVGIAMSAINIASGALSAAAQIKAVATGLKAVGGGSAGSAPNMNAGGGAGGAAPPAVAFNNTAENQIGQSIAKTQAEQPPLQVTVLESDISKAQNNVSTLVKTNTF